MAIGGRDILVLLLAASAILFSIQSEGDLTLHLSWFEDFQGVPTYRNGFGPDPSEKVPLPVVADLEGDGENEIVFVTRDAMIKIVTPKRTDEFASRSSLFDPSEWKDGYNKDDTTQDIDDESSLKVLAQASLLSSTIVKSGRQAVGLATGYLDPYSTEKNRQQVIIVVTEGWSILCFDHKLNLLWERTVDSDFSHSFLTEVSIAISSHAMKSGDRGLIVIGGRLESRQELETFGLHSRRQRRSRSTPTTASSGQAEQGEAIQRRLLQDDTPADEEEGGAPANADLAPEQETLMNEGHTHFGANHYSFYAFEGKTGEMRWKHEADDFYEETSASDILRPQHEVHSGEMDWRNFRHSFLDALPHVWTNREHSRLEIAHFSRRRSGQDRQAQKESDLQKSNEWVDTLFGAQRPHAQSEHVLNPNAIVAHLKDGLEVIHLYTGRPLSRLALRYGQLHADLNGDAVIDHAEAFGLGGRGYRARARRDGNNPNCQVVVTTGIPPSDQLWNTSLCRTGTRAFFFHPAVKSQAEDFEKRVRVATPALIEDQSKTVSSLQTAGGHITYQTVYFLNTGTVAAYTSDGKLAFHVSTPSWWLTDQQQATKNKPDRARRNRRRGGRPLKLPKSDVGLPIRRHSFYPSIAPFSLKADPDMPKDHIAVVGEQTVSIIDQSGSLRSEAMIPSLAVSSPVIGDFNNDGINDIIIVTCEGYAGLLVEQRLGSRLFMVLTSILIIALLAALTWKYKSSSPSSDPSPSTPSSYSHPKTTATYYASLTKIPRRRD